MQYIKVLATDSTNADLKRRYRAHEDMPNTCLSADFQRHGKGQRGTKWTSNHGNNLTFSMLLKKISLNPADLFKLNILTSLSLRHHLNQIHGLHELTIKWPNDILAGNQKVAGILIEPLWKAQKIQQVVIGIGLNVNQTDFTTLPRASSLKLLTGRSFNLDKLLKTLVEGIEKRIYNGINLSMSELIDKYETYLFRLNKPSNFTFVNVPDQKTGIIRGISPQGKLKVELDQETHLFDLKEIRLIY